MKTYLTVSITCVICLLGYTGFSQRANPLENDSRGVFKVKTKEEMANNLSKLTAKGRAEYAQAKNDYKKIKSPKFEIAPNEVSNRDPKELLGGMKMQSEDKELIKTQNQENKKNEKEIKDKLNALNIKTNSLTFEYSYTPPDLTLSPYATCSWNKSILTPVRNQKTCGSCWAFAAAASFEHTYAKFYGTRFDLSEQQIVACGNTCSGRDAGSCNGGLGPRAFDYIKCQGVTLEQYYSYTAASGPCYKKPTALKAYTWGQVYPGRFPTVNEIKSYINAYGAVLTYMKAGINTFYNYGGGVYNGYPNTTPTDHDHEVIIVGWCDDLNAWIIKNSWGTGWGPYGGYAYVGYDQCNIAKYVFWIYPNKLPS